MRWVDAEIIDQPSGSLALTLREAGSGKAVARGDGTSLSLSFEPKLWDEFTPNLYRLDVALGEYRHEIAFGFRTTSRDSHRLLINGRPTFLRWTSALLLSAFCLCSAVALGWLRVALPASQGSRFRLRCLQ